MDAVNIGPSDGALGEEHGTKRIGLNREEGAVPQSKPKQARSRNRTRRRPKNAQQDNPSSLLGESGADAGSTPAEASKLGAIEEDEDLEVDNDDELDVHGDDGEDVDANGADDEKKPKELSAKMKKKMTRMATTMKREAGHVLLTLESDALIPAPFQVKWDEEPELLCCYNWQGANDGTNTIFVPGGPAKWTAKPLPHTLETDAGYQAADYNYVRKPYDPYAPLFSALGVMKPGYQFWDIDVLADRNNLRLLLEFIQGKANGPLRLDVYTVYNTLVLVRKGEVFWKRHDAQSQFGIGNNFEKSFTSPGEDMEDATSHYRAIRYPMGNLECVVRFEADAYYDESTCDELDPTEVAAVTGALLAERPFYDFKPPVQFLQKGHIIPSAQMAELKTMVHHPEGTNSVACQDQLWFGRTTHLLTGIYKVDADAKTGEVMHVKYENAKERVDKWEERNQENLRKLVDLLTRVRTALQQQQGPTRTGILVRESRDGPLVLRTMLRRGTHIVQRDVFEAHWNRAQAPRVGGGRGNWNAGRSNQAGPQPGMRGYHTQSGGMRSNNFQSQRGGYGSATYQDYTGLGGQNAQHQPGSMRGGWNGGRGSESSRGYHGGRGRGRGRGYGVYDPNIGRLSRDF